MMPLARRVRELTPSATLQAKADADNVRRGGIDVIDFGPGEPDFHTPEPIKEAAKLALDQNFTHYVETGGIPELREGLAQRFHRDYHTDYGPDEVMIGCGGKNILYLLSQALFEAGDRVAMFSPYWVSFPDQVRLAGAEPLILPTREEEGFSPRAHVLEGALSQGRIKALILNTPCNPTGAEISQSEIERFAEAARRHDFLIISDETYESFHYGEGPFASFAGHASQLRDRLVVVGSFSKSFAMTGWRVGYSLGPKEIIGAMIKIQSHDATHTASFSMKGAVAALALPRRILDSMRDEYRHRRDLVLEGLARVEGVSCVAPEGAYYVFPNMKGFMSRFGFKTSTELARGLLLGLGVATVPGLAFGTEGHLRISYAVSRERIQEGLKRLRECRRLSPPGESR
jgi:aspartate aminotransferase